MPNKNAKQPPPPSKRPWLARKTTETEPQRQQRLNRTCYHCGVYIADGDALDAHEASHG